MKKKKKASMLARRRRGGVESEDEGSLDAPQSDSSETDDSEEDQRDEDEEDDDDSSSESDSEDGSEEENESQVDSDEDESTETKVEPAETSKAKPNPLENSNLTDPTTIAESLANISISKDWAEEAQEEENKQASSNKLPKQDSTPSTDLSNSSEIPKSKKSKSQRRREAKAKAKSLASSEAPPQAEAQQPQPIRTNANVTFPTSRTNPKISPRNGSLGNHADRASVASSGGLGAGRRGGAPPSAPSVRGALNGNGSRLLEMNGRGGMSGSRGGKGGSFSRGGGRGGSNSNSSTRGKGRMMSWSDDEEDGNGNSLVVDEDALEGKVVKTLPKELRIQLDQRLLEASNSQIIPLNLPGSLPAISHPDQLPQPMLMEPTRLVEPRAQSVKLPLQFLPVLQLPPPRSLQPTTLLRLHLESGITTLSNLSQQMVVSIVAECPEEEVELV